MFHSKFISGCLLFSSQVLLATTVNLTVTENSDTAVNTGGVFDSMTNSGDLRGCLHQINALATVQDYNITFANSGTITLNGLLPILNYYTGAAGGQITIDGGSIIALDGNEQFSGFLIPTGTVTIRDITLQNMKSQGGNGGSGISAGGGAMGGGAAIFLTNEMTIGDAPIVTLSNVTIHSCSAIGGTGGDVNINTTAAGGGGGVAGGTGGSVTVTGGAGGAGGGGYGGAGGNVLSNSGGGGGGGGISTGITGGGNGGSDTSAGEDSAEFYNISTTLVPAAGSGGSGSGPFPGGGATTSLGGGGGGGGGGPSSGNACGGGGGGGPGGSDGGNSGSSPGFDPVSGGNGGDGGGGGGGGIYNVGENTASAGGQGGALGGGGGGGNDSQQSPAAGGQSGFGGGGGGGGTAGIPSSASNPGGNSSGGGGGGGGPGNGASGGTEQSELGGGSGGTGGASLSGGGGGGGSALGGAVFVDNGSTLILKGNTTFGSQTTSLQNVVTAGSGGSHGGGDGFAGTAGSTAGSDLFFSASATLNITVDSSETVTFYGSIGDQSSLGGAASNLIISGTGGGTALFQGNSTFGASTGTTTVSNANLVVNGNFASSQVTINTGGILSGTGILAGAVSIDDGIISPGNSPGTLTVGSLSLTSNSITEIEFAQGSHSEIISRGAATLAGTLSFIIDPGSVISGDYTIVSSSGLGGTEFSSILFSSPVRSYKLTYGLQDVILNLQAGQLPTAGLSGNNLKIANYFNHLLESGNSTSIIEQIVSLSSLSSDQYVAALESISPAGTAIPTFIAENVMFLFSNIVSSHLAERRLSRVREAKSLKSTALLFENKLFADASSSNRISQPDSQSSACDGWNQRVPHSIWINGFGQFASQSSQNQTPSFGFKTGGAVAGYDYGNGEQGTLGTLAGYAHSSLHEHQHAGSATTNSGYGSLYGTAIFSDFYFDLALWGAFVSIDQKRNIFYPGYSSVAKSSHNAAQLDTHFGAGYDFHIDPFVLEPFAMLDWVKEWDESFHETGGGSYDVSEPARQSWMLRAETGFNSFYTKCCSWGLLIGSTKLSYVYRKPNHTGDVTASLVGIPGSFTVETFTEAQNLISPSAELFFRAHWNGYVSVRYQGEYGSGYSSSEIYGTLGQNF